MRWAASSIGRMLNTMRHAKEPVIRAEASCQEVMHLASDPDFDVRTLLPAPTNTAEDAGPYFNVAVLTRFQAERRSSRSLACAAIRSTRPLTRTSSGRTSTMASQRR